MTKVLIGRAVTGVGLSLWATMAFAQYGGSEGQVTNFFSQTTTWLVSNLGPFVFIVGLILVGASLAVGNERALERGYYVVSGGALIFMSQGLVALVRRLAGAF